MFPKKLDDFQASLLSWETRQLATLLLLDNYLYGFVYVSFLECCVSIQLVSGIANFFVC